jgi:putative phosphoribosyl transferase
MRRFIDRADAGRDLAAMLSTFTHRSDVVVLGVSRGGLAVASEVAEALGVPLDVWPSRADRSLPDVAGRTVVLVDDGLVTGNTMRAAIADLRRREPARIVAATPVASREAVTALRGVADACVCAFVPTRLYTLDLWYEDFSTASDAEVSKLMRRAGVLQPCG